MNGLINNAHTLITKGNKNDISNINVLIEDTINQLVLHKNIHNINQFYPVFIIFLDRLYGEDINFQYDNAVTSSTGGSSSISTKGSAGGWLKALVETTSEVYSSSSSSNNSRYDDNSQYALKTSYLDTVSSSTQRLLKFFIPTTSLLLDLLNKSQSRFELNIAMLPSKLQMYLNEHPAVISFNSSNLDQICHHLLLYPLHSTLQVRYLYTLPICMHTYTYIHNVILATHCIPSTTYVNNIPVDSLFILSIYHTSFPSLNIS